VTAPKPGMGRGLAAILAASDLPSATEGVRELAVELIAPNPNQPRRTIDPESLQALASSLREQGVLQPVLVRPRAGGYELIAGERRWRAAQLAGIERIPALVRPTDDAETLELALIENMAREDLNPVEEARACAALAEELGLTREEIGRRVGRSRVAISNLVRLLELPDEVLEMLEQGTLSEGHGRALLMAEDHDARRRLARAAAGEGWSVRATERRAREANQRAAGTPHPERALAGGVHPDREAGAREIAETLEAALGAPVRVRADARGRYKAELAFESHEEALALAQRLRPRSVA
jgi:ParB family transcriptional regulator, chromosome partitioning protein